jgi:hypothetical protein
MESLLMRLPAKQISECPNCGALVDGLFSRVPPERLRWYSSSTMRGCAHCGTKLDYDSASKRWLLLNLLIVLPLLWPGDTPRTAFYIFVALALFGDLMFVRTRKLVTKR